MNRFQSSRTGGNSADARLWRGGWSWGSCTLALLFLGCYMSGVAAESAVVTSGNDDYNILASDETLRIYNKGHNLKFVLQQDGAYLIEPSPDDGFWGLHSSERLLSVDGQRAKTPRDLIALLGRKNAATIQLTDGHAVLRRNLDDRLLAIFRSIAKGPDPVPNPPGGLPTPPRPASMAPTHLGDRR